jgi:uncharacterized protein (DUF302 family)
MANYLLEKKSALSPQEVRMRMDGALRRHGFEPVGFRNVSEMYLKTGQPVDDSIWTVEFVSPGLARDAYRQFPQIAVLGPYRIAVYTVNGTTRLATMLPQAYVKIFPKSFTRPSILRPYQKILKDYAVRLRRVLSDLSV